MKKENTAWPGKDLKDTAKRVYKLIRQTSLLFNPKFHEIRRQIYYTEQSNKVEDILATQEKLAQKKIDQQVRLAKDYVGRKEQLKNITNDKKLLENHHRKVHNRNTTWGDRGLRTFGPAFAAVIGGSLGALSGGPAGAVIGAGCGLAGGLVAGKAIQNAFVKKGIPFSKSWRQASEIMKSKEKILQFEKEMNHPLSKRMEEGLNEINKKHKKLPQNYPTSTISITPKNDLENSIAALKNVIKKIKKKESLIQQLENSTQNETTQGSLENAHAELRNAVKNAVKHKKLAHLALQEIHYDHLRNQSKSFSSSSEKKNWKRSKSVDSEEFYTAEIAHSTELANNAPLTKPEKRSNHHTDFHKFITHTPNKSPSDMNKKTKTTRHYWSKNKQSPNDTKKTTITNEIQPASPKIRSAKIRR